jgi:hypothetical protein
LVCLALRTRHKEAGNKQKHCPLMSGSPFRFYSFFLEKEDIAKKKSQNTTMLKYIELGKGSLGIGFTICLLD